MVAPEDAMIELESLHRLLGASGRFSFGSAALMRETLGVEPGSVTPFAVINDKAGQVTVILDAAMMAHETLNFHPLVNTATTTLHPNHAPAGEGALRRPTQRGTRVPTAFRGYLVLRPPSLLPRLPWPWLRLPVG